eukprot:scaffold770_cov255-Pinguiococcus_pyrenoidosus.AAC.54
MNSTMTDHRTRSRNGSYIPRIERRGRESKAAPLSAARKTSAKLRFAAPVSPEAQPRAARP